MKKTSKPQIFLVHGWMTFKSWKNYLKYLEESEVSLEWRKSRNKEYLDEKLGKDFDIFRPRFPLSQNAKYKYWKIYFEKYIPLFSKKLILIWNSLGWIFLAKYLSENKFPRKIQSVYLVCPPYRGWLPTEDLVWWFKLWKDLSLLQQNCKNLYLIFSADDDVVPISHAELYKKKLPNANIFIYNNKNGHFGVSEFPEIVKLLRWDLKEMK